MLSGEKGTEITSCRFGWELTRGKAILHFLDLTLTLASSVESLLEEGHSSLPRSDLDSCKFG